MGMLNDLIAENRRYEDALREIVKLGHTPYEAAMMKTLARDALRDKK